MYRLPKVFLFTATFYVVAAIVVSEFLGSVSLQDLLSDGLHLRDHGDRLVFERVLAHLVDPKLGLEKREREREIAAVEKASEHASCSHPIEWAGHGAEL